MKHVNKVFTEVLSDHGFIKVKKGWAKPVDYGIMFIWLQRSQYSSLTYINLEILVNGLHPPLVTFHKSINAMQSGHVHHRPHHMYNRLLMDIKNQPEFELRNTLQMIVLTEFQVIFEATRPIDLVRLIEKEVVTPNYDFVPVLKQAYGITDTEE